MTRRGWFGLVAAAIAGGKAAPAKIQSYVQWQYERFLLHRALYGCIRPGTFASIPIRFVNCYWIPAQAPASRGEPGVRFCVAGGAAATADAPAVPPAYA
jgi:hypothetical protein